MSTKFPDDLIPLPTAPYAERPAYMALDVEECRTAIWRTEGNIVEAAKMLKIEPSRLRKFVAKSPRLQGEVDEAREQLIDKAESVVAEALDDPDRADAMARFVLGSTRARSRGWGNGAQSNVSINAGGSNFVFQWGDGSAVKVDDGKTIEGELVNE